MTAVAFALPIPPGQEENMRRLSEEVLASGQLRDAYEKSRRKLGITREMTWLQPTPVGGYDHRLLGIRRHAVRAAGDRRLPGPLR